MSSAAKASAPCPIHGMLEILAGPWTLEILWALSTDGPTRFGDLRRRVNGVSSRVLAERLRMLEQQGFVFRRYKATIPPSATYGITARMEPIRKVLDDLHALSRGWRPTSAQTRMKRGGTSVRRKIRKPATRSRSTQAR